VSSHVPSIEQLKELSLPAPVSYWPQTWGWGVLLGILVVALLVLAGRKWLRWRRDAYRREALARLDTLKDLRELPELLKRVVLSMPLSMEEQQRTPTLRGAEWQAFLQRHAAGPIPDDLAERLAELAYGAAPQDPQLLAHCKAWVEQHHVAA
jgi:hypothetical protein